MTDTVSYAEHEMLMLDYQAADKERRRLARQLAAVEAENRKVEDTPEAQNVLALLELWWREVKASHPSVAYGLDSTRAPKVRAALKRRTKIAKGLKGVEDPEGYALDLCRRAILGVTLDDWAMGRIKKSGGKCFNDIAEHVLNTDGDIEKFAGLYDQHQAKEPQPASPSKPVLKLVTPEPVEYDPLTVVYERAQWLGLDPQGEVWRFRAQCPAHEDGDRSLLVIEEPDGRAGLWCAAKCDPEKIAAKLSIPWGGLFPLGHRHHRLSTERKAA